MYIKLYYGFGHTHDLMLYGHLFDNKPVIRKGYSNSVLINTWHLIRLFFLRPVPGRPVELHWEFQKVQNKTATDGFIRMEWSSATSVPAGWHPVEVQHSHNGTLI